MLMTIVRYPLGFSLRKSTTIAKSTVVVFGRFYDVENLSKGHETAQIH